LTFFGLGPSHRVSLFNQIDEIVFHGGGGYDWLTVYHMPIWIRKFTFNKMRERFEKKQGGDEIEKWKENMRNAQVQSDPGVIKDKPSQSPVKPTYTTKKASDQK
jgi:hypothetical protein